MKVSKGQPQPELAADIRLLYSLHGSGSIMLIPGFDYDSDAPLRVAGQDEDGARRAPWLPASGRS